MFLGKFRSQRKLRSICLRTDISNAITGNWFIDDFFNEYDELPNKGSVSIKEFLRIKEPVLKQNICNSFLTHLNRKYKIKEKYNEEIEKSILDIIEDIKEEKYIKYFSEKYLYDKKEYLESKEKYDKIVNYIESKIIEDINLIELKHEVLKLELFDAYHYVCKTSYTITVLNEIELYYEPDRNPEFSKLYINGLIYINNFSKFIGQFIVLYNKIEEKQKANEKLKIEKLLNKT